MTDVFNSRKRSEIMASIRPKDTAPEMMLRKSLHRIGYRYRLHTNNLPGKPDLVFRQYQAIIFVNGCFWHGHDCHLFRLPSSNQDYWQSKIENNRSRDENNRKLLLADGWRILTVWECSMRGRERLDFELMISNVDDWLKSNCKHLEIRGKIEAC